MTVYDPTRWEHDHSFGQDEKRPGEVRTVIVIVVTAITMIVEIAAGLLYGSMALLADGLHMGSHAAALSINLFAYVYARRHAADKRFSFGTGKVNALGGFSGAVLLAVFALLMAGESVHRLIAPVEIAFNQALVVAVVGLIVNGASIFVLKSPDGHGHDHDHHDHHHDHNLRSAYLHVLADTLTSLLAIFALLAGKYLGLAWMDPVMGVVGACLVARWSFGLLLTSSTVLLDHQAPERVRAAICSSIKQDGDHVADIHVWSIGPGIYAAIISIVSDDPKPPKYYKDMIPDELNVLHTTVEVHRHRD